MKRDTDFAAGAVLENLLVWVARKQAELSRTHPRTRVDRLPISQTSEPELWVQLDSGDKEAIQWTISVRADGKVAVQFQYMRPPFDTEEARRQLHDRLNAIPGIGLEARLGGRPTFPLTALVNEACHAQFLAAIDFVIDETILMKPQDWA